MGEEKFYTVKCAFRTEVSNGKKGTRIKVVSETYLVSAIAVMDVEAIITKFLRNSVSEWEIKSIATSPIVKVLDKTTV